MAKDEDQKKKDYKSGKQFGISGREMFSFNPDLVDDGPIEDGDAAFDIYERDEDDDEEITEYKELDLDILAAEAQEVDGSGTVASDDRLKKAEAAAAAARSRNAQEDVVDATPFNEDLFLDEDLGGLDDELNELNINDDNQKS